MKNIFIILLLLFSTTILSYEEWPSDVEAAYLLDNDLNDDSGKGRHGVVVQAMQYSDVIKYHGTYSAYTTTQGYFNLPVAVNLATVGKNFTIQWLQYSTNIASPYHGECFKSDGGYTTFGFVANWIGGGDGYPVPFSRHNYGYIYGGPYNPDVISNRWVLMSIEYDAVNNIRRDYVAGVLKFVWNNQGISNNPLTTIYSDINRPIYFGRDHNNNQHHGYIDNIIVATKLYNGVEIVPMEVIRMRYVEKDKIRYGDGF